MQTQPRNRKRSSYCPALERLESRDTPSSTAVTTNLTSKILTVEGTDQADRITVSYANGTVRVQASTAATGASLDRTFSAALTAWFVVSGEGGNDTIVIDPSIRVGTRLDGGWGNDVLYGGDGADVIFGGDGNDSIFGRAGNDILFGGAGSNTIDGGAGTNSIVQGVAPRPYYGNALELEVVRLVNVERTSRGLAPLALSAVLSSASKLHATNMANWSNAIGPAAMSHTLYGTLTPTQSMRLNYAGYANARTWGENVAYGYSTALQVVTCWMNSPGHRANILSASFTEIGVGMYSNAAGQIYWCQNFGARF